MKQFSFYVFSSEHLTTIRISGDAFALDGVSKRSNYFIVKICLK